MFYILQLSLLSSIRYPLPQYIIHNSCYSIMISLGKDILILAKYFKGEGNGTPLQYCCLENPMDGGAW